MELLFTHLMITSVLVVAASFLLEPSSAHHQNSLQHLDDAELPQYPLPRKLYFHQETMKYSNSACEDCTPHKKLQQSSSPDTKQDEKEMKSAATEVVVFEEEKGPNKSEYFTMDYGWIRRRRPIHNKQLPLVP